MSPVLFGWSPAESSCGATDSLWDGLQSSSSAPTEPSLNEALEWFSLPATPAALGEALNTGLLQNDPGPNSQARSNGAESAWNIPSTSPLETARSTAGEPQAAPATTSDSWVERANPSEDGTRQAGGTQSRYTTEKKLLKNREAQRRFRQRNKAKSHGVEAQLAATTSELQELRARQQQLEARNTLLEKISYLSSKKPSHKALDEGRPDHGVYSAAQPFLHHLPCLTISLPGQQRNMTGQEASQLSLQQFSALYTEYNCEIGACLLHLKAGPDPAVEARMQTLTLEALTLTGRVMLNPANHKAIVNGRLDEARPVAQRPGRPFYESILVVMNLSNRQARDLMYIRRLNLTQRCNLSAERKALMHQMALSESEALINRSDNLSTVSKLAARLQQNTAEDRQVYYKLARATYRGVLSSRQLSEAMVHAYPYIAVVETLLDTLADQRGEPSKDSIVAAAHLHPMIQEWQDFIHYVSQFDQSCCYDYVPVLPQT